MISVVYRQPFQKFLDPEPQFRYRNRSVCVCVSTYIHTHIYIYKASLMAQMVKYLPAVQEIQV